MVSWDDVHRGFRFLYAGPCVVEVGAYHPDYRAGDRAWNREHGTWPVTTYITTERELCAVLRRYAGERVVCYGLNPRPGVLRRADGEVRSARESDIAASQNLLVDIDLEGTVTPARLESLRGFLGLADDYFTSIGISRPFRALTGRGSHLLFAYPPIRVCDVPDLRERLRSFKDNFAHAMRQDLSHLEARVDSTQDLRRMTRVYGSAKPDVNVVSRFYGTVRVEDVRLREHLRGLEVPHQVLSSPVPVLVGGRLPDWFTQLLDGDDVVRNLWNGTGKQPGSDRTNSGYDYSIVRYLAGQGYRDPNELGTILALRPNGYEQRCAKGPSYLARTVAHALGDLT